MELGNVVSKRQKSRKEGDFKRWEVDNILDRIFRCMRSPVDGGAPVFSEREAKELCSMLGRKWDDEGSKKFFDRARYEITRMGLYIRIYPPRSSRMKPQEKADRVGKEVSGILNDTMKDIGTRPDVVKFFGAVVPAILYKPNMSLSQIRKEIANISNDVFGKPKPNGGSIPKTSEPKKVTKQTEPVTIPKESGKSSEFEAWSKRMSEKLGGNNTK